MIYDFYLLILHINSKNIFTKTQTVWNKWYFGNVNKKKQTTTEEPGGCNYDIRKKDKRDIR